MKRLFNRRIFMLTALLLMGAFTTASAERPVRIERPFALNGSGSSVSILDGAGNVIGATLNASGRSTHLGLWVATGELQFTPDPDNPNIIHEAGTAILVAENGDKIAFVLRDGLTDVTTALTEGTMQITGGTGRFANATGSVNLVVLHYFLTGAFEMTAVGKIRF